MDIRTYEICSVDSRFPEYLKSVRPTVNRIFACGNLELFGKKSIAVIGSRNSSEYGRGIARKITKELVDNNIVIISGMALGIDSIAHETCIENGGKTIAVLGSGFKNIFPKENEKLFQNILASGGLVVSEFPLDEPVQMKNFPKRNRIISGLSDGVLVVEAAYRSGTSITAKNAIIQGKKVFCIPNSIGNKNSYGAIRLAKSGAVIVTSGYEILSGIGIKKEENVDSAKKILNDKIEHMDLNTKKIFLCLKENEFLDSEQISIKTGIDIVNVNQLLTYMELDEIIVNTGISKYKLSEAYSE